MLGLLGDVGTHMGSIGKQLITSSLPDWSWCQAQLVSRSHYYVIMLGDVGTHMGLIGKQNLLQLHHHRCYVIRQFSCLVAHLTHPCHPPMLPTHTRHLPTLAAHPTHAAHHHLPMHTPHPRTQPTHAAHACTPPMHSAHT